MFLISLESFSVLFSLTSSASAFEDSSLLFLFSSGLLLDKFSDAVTSDLAGASSTRPANFLTDWKAEPVEDRLAADEMGGEGIG